MHRSRGLTLIELMATVAIAVILMTLAVPSYQGIARDSRLSGEANGLIGALNLARSEAAKRGESIDVVSTSGDTDWARGWTVQVAATAELLRVGETLDGDSLTGSASRVRYQATGFAAAGTTFDLCATGSGEGRRITVQASGRVESGDLTCP